MPPRAYRHLQLFCGIGGLSAGETFQPSAEPVWTRQIAAQCSVEVAW